MASDWRYEGNRWIWRFTVPQDPAIRVRVPGEKEDRLFGPGDHVVERPEDVEGIAVDLR